MVFAVEAGHKPNAAMNMMNALMYVAPTEHVGERAQNS
jgi:hypothetical protein